MSRNLIDEFNVVSLDDSESPLHTWVNHDVSEYGDQDIIRIEQEGLDPDVENDVVILTRKDFERLAALLKGH